MDLSCFHSEHVDYSTLFKMKRLLFSFFMKQLKAIPERFAAINKDELALQQEWHFSTGDENESRCLSLRVGTAQEEKTLLNVFFFSWRESDCEHSAPFASTRRR